MNESKTPTLEEYFASLDDPQNALDFLIDGAMEEAKTLGETLPAGGERMTHMCIARAQWRNAFRKAWKVGRQE